PICQRKPPVIGIVDKQRTVHEDSMTNTRPAARGAALSSRADDDGAARFIALAERVRADPAAYPNVRVLAGAAEASASDVTAAILAHAHVTPAAWLLCARIAAAEDRLHESRARIASIADALGFRDEETFR